jgi:uncharacterized membrane protein
MNFLPLTFLAPLYLVGAASAAVPLVIHLSRSRRQKKMRFSTTRFFTDEFLRSYRMSRLKELALLACRMALCALLAVALAQPLLAPNAGRGAAGANGRSRSVAIVLDDSASMGYVEEGVPLIRRARDAAAQVIRGLKPGDRVGVVLAGRRADGPEVPVAPPTDRLDDAIRAVDGVEAAPLGTDLAGAISKAESLVRDGPASSKEVYVFSDLQESGWGEAAEGEKVDGSGVSFVFVQVRPRQPVTNVGVQYAASRPMVGAPFVIRPLLSVNDSTLDAVNVRLYVDGEKVGEQRAERLQTGRWAAPRFYHTFTRGGWHAGYVEVDDKTMSLDNRRHFALEVVESVRVLAVDGAPSQVRRLDELFFLNLALTASPEGRASPIAVDTVTPRDLGATDLAKYATVILANVESLSAEAVDKLEEHAAEGGGVLFFLGDKVDRNFYNETLAGPNRRNGGLLPCKLREVEGDPAGQKDVATVGEVNVDHAALAAFGDPRFAALSGLSVTFKAMWRTDADPADVLMRTSTGTPLLVEKPFGKGRVLLFTSTADRDWTNFPVRPAYLPWTHRLVAYLARGPRSARTFYQTGDKVPLTPPGDTAASVLVKRPDGVVGTAVPADDGNGFVFTDTARAGVYTILAPDRNGTAGLFAANLERGESDLTYLDDSLAENAGESADRAAAVEKGLTKLLGRPLVTYVDDPARVGEVIGGGRAGFRLWDGILFVVLALALFEPWLANRISGRLYGKPREVPTVAGRVPAGRATPEGATR